MSSHLLQCTCGAEIVVETRAAGQQVSCACGKTLVVPTLLALKKLPLASESVSTTSTKSTSSTATKPNKNSARLVLRFLGFVAMLITFPLFFMVWSNYPLPYEVLAKQRAFRFGDTWIVQDSTPISEMEQWILVLSLEDIEAMPLVTAYFYLDALKDGPALSFNFRENYQRLLDWYYIRVVMWGILAALSLGAFVTSWLLPNREISVGQRSGNEWR